MSKLTYRMKSDAGMSEGIPLDVLQQMSAQGEIQIDELCTTDDGQTWQSLATILEEPSMASDSAPRVADDVSSLSANDTSVKASSETIPDGIGGRRKLKRMSVASGKSRFAKVSTDRTKQKIGESKKELDGLVGTTLPGGRYKVLSQFGSGSMAYVFRASDNRLETDVIIKVPKPEKITTDDFRERFKRESQLLVRLSHPHVVKVVDVGEFDDLPYVVMQLLSGGTLLDRMRKDSNELNQMSPRSLTIWVREVARALDFCFKKGMVHRDVKPANILFDDDDNAYVSDFGLTKIMHGEHTELCSSGTANGVVLGTPNYLPPEIILGAKYDGRADQYSLAMTVYHALCGRPPMLGASATATMINQTQKKLELLSSFRTDIPRELALAVQKGIEKNPKNRFETSVDFANAVLEGLRTDASSSSIVTAPSAPVASKVVEEWYEDSSASSRKTKRKSNHPAKKKKRKSSSASSSSRMKPEWTESSSKKLPPKKGAASRIRAKRNTPRAKTIAVFGHDVHPVALAVAGLCVVLPTVVFLAFQFRGTGDVNDGVVVDSEARSYEQPSTESDVTSSPEKSPLEHDGGHQKTARAPDSRTSSGVGDAGTVASTADPQKPSSDSSAPTKVAMVGSGSLAGMNSPMGPAADSTTLSPSPSLSNSDSTEMTPSDSTSVSEAGSEVMSSGRRRDVLSSQLGAKVTHGPPNCPVIVIGNSVWSVVNRRQNANLEGEYDRLAQTTLSADGHFFAAASKPPGQQNTDVIVWDTNTGRKLFTAAGDSKRFVDTILLSKEKLFIGDRWSGELFVWECESGKKKKALKIRDAKFKHGNTAISHGGEFVAAVAHNQLSVFNAQNSDRVVSLASPRAASRKPDSAEALYASLQSLSFSPDNNELATISTVNGTRLLCWNGRGEIVAEESLGAEMAECPTVQWFASRGAWLLGPNIFDRESQMVLLTALNGDGSHANVHLYDDDHMCGYFADNPDEVTLAAIPWDEIDTSVLVMKSDAGAVLRPGSEVSIVLESRSKKRESNGILRRALKSKLVASGLKVTEGLRTRFVVRMTRDDEVFIPQRRLQLTLQERESESYSRAVGPQLVVELFAPTQTDPVWSVSLGEASSLIDTDDLSETERNGRVERFVQAIGRMAVPYYLPSNKELIALPAVLW